MANIELTVSLGNETFQGNVDFVPEGPDPVANAKRVAEQIRSLADRVETYFTP